MRLPARSGRGDGTADAFRLLVRDTYLTKRQKMNGVNWAIVGIFVGLLTLLVLTVAIFLIRRRRQASRPKTENGVKSGLWARIFGRKRGEYRQASGGARANRRGNGRARNTADDAGNTATIDRRTSIRSVITLPAYRQAASHEERVLGREGERDGVDVVIDLPTQEDEEAMREQEMDTLYQIRLARRQQLAEREDRRRARERGIQPARTRDENREAIRELRVEVDRIKETRQRSVSSVSYGDLGVARHDGSRVRAGSNDSERMGLLNDAADISRAGMNSPRPSHLRGRSTSSLSVLSMDNDAQSLRMSATRSGENTPRMSVGGLSLHRQHAVSTPDLTGHDSNDGASPPEYENVSLDPDDASRRAPSPFERAETPANEPPPSYPGPHRNDSQRSRDSQPEELAQSTESLGSSANGSGQNSPSRRIGSRPQLSSLRLSRLPSIVVEPSSAAPRAEDA